MNTAAEVSPSLLRPSPTNHTRSTHPQDDGSDAEAWKRVATNRRERTPFDLSSASGEGPDIARIGNRIINISVLSLWAVPGFFDPIRHTLGPAFLPAVTVFVLVQWGIDNR